MTPGTSQSILKGILSSFSRPIQKLDIFEDETRVPTIAPMHPRLLTVSRFGQLVEVEQLLRGIPGDCLDQQSAIIQHQLRAIVRGEEMAEQQLASRDREIRPRKL